MAQIRPNTMHFQEPFQLKNGEVLTEYQLVYETYGQLNQKKNNVVLVCHALNGSHHAAGSYLDLQNKKGWWDNMIGENKPIDTSHFFVICINNLGSCFGSTGPMSPNPKTGNAYGSSFPFVAVEDIVHSQAKLLENLGVTQLCAVVGGSLGGMQALAWNILYPNRIAHTVMLASTPYLSMQNIGFNIVAESIIVSDPVFCGGDYYLKDQSPKKSLAIARMLNCLTYLPDQYLTQKFMSQKLCVSAETDCTSFDARQFDQLESYLNYQAEKFADNFDANSYLLAMRAAGRFYPAKEYGGCLDKALSMVQSHFLVISFKTDWRFSPERSRELVAALKANDVDVQYDELDMPKGHDAFLMHDDIYFNVMYDYFSHIVDEISQKNTS